MSAYHVMKELVHASALRISSYGCAREVRITLLSCAPNFQRASRTRYTHVKHGPILSYFAFEHWTMVWIVGISVKKKNDKRINPFFCFCFTFCVIK